MGSVPGNVLYRAEQSEQASLHPGPCWGSCCPCLPFLYPSGSLMIRTLGRVRRLCVPEGDGKPPEKGRSEQQEGRGPSASSHDQVVPSHIALLNVEFSMRRKGET